MKMASQESSPFPFGFQALLFLGGLPTDMKTSMNRGLCFGDAEVIMPSSCPNSLLVTPNPTQTGLDLVV